MTIRLTINLQDSSMPRKNEAGAKLHPVSKAIVRPSKRGGWSVIDRDSGVRLWNFNTLAGAKAAARQLNMEIQ